MGLVDFIFNKKYKLFFILQTKNYKTIFLYLFKPFSFITQNMAFLMKINFHNLLFIEEDIKSISEYKSYGY